MEAGPSDHPRVEDEAGIGVKMLTAVAEALAKNGAPAGYRIVYRTNPNGEHVVAIIWSREAP